MQTARIPIWLVLAALLGVHVAQPQDRFLQGRPFTLQEISVGVGSVAPQRLRAAIENRGVDFVATDSNLEKLKSAGASAELLDAIKRVAPKPPPPPPPPPPEKKGSLAVECDPAECDIGINGKPRGSTASGRLIVPELSAGNYVIDIVKSGYLSQQEHATVEPEKTSKVSARLTPEMRTRELLGARLMVRMIDAMGGPAAFKKAERVTATGKVTLSDQFGRRSEWALVAHLTPPGSVFLDKLKNGKTSAWIELAGESAPRTSHKFEQIPEASNLQDAARMLRRFQPFAIIGRIEQEKTRLLARHPRDLVFQAEIESEVYQITLGPDYLPLRIQHQPGGMADRAIELVYSGYDSRAAVRFPTGIRIQGPGAQPVRFFQFESVSFDPTLKPK